MMKVASCALGCKVNQYESEAIAELFAQRGYDIVNIDEAADIYIINTCTVTNLGDKKSRQLIRRVKRKNPNAVVAAIGCYAQTAPEEIKGIEGVNLIIGTKGRKDIVELIESYNPEMGVLCMVGTIEKENEFEKLSINKLKGRTRAYVKIQDGCSQFCSYCIIPYARGPIRSRAPEDIYEELHILAENGFREVILTGIHVASYGKDLKGVSLLDIVRAVQNTEGIERIRFSSMEPNIMSEKFVAELSEMDKVCDHFHLSLQSGCDKTLKKMNRKYTSVEYRKSSENLRRYFPDCALTTDIIAGFPGESDEDFEKSLKFAEEIGFLKIHAFPYSPKRGTPAAAMNEQLSSAVKAERTARLIELSNRSGKDFIEKVVGKTVPVLFEQAIGENLYEGYTTNYIKVVANSRVNIKNEILNTEILLGKTDTAEGRIQL
ncbi:threonylcarbamoyladenosine tRNA methylthiotransferase MtaB [Clostridiales bacterium]|nr:threonylcarbamoyladenosine tRNA methylthiotransferase MtaB [Clostridiales bacterium]